MNIKPICLCLVKLGDKGLEIVKNYPNALPDEVLSQISIKSMPLNAKDGDFISTNINNNYLSGYVFTTPSTKGRGGIASLVAIFNTMQYNTEIIKKVFSFTITELRKNDLVSVDVISEILPKLYTGLTNEMLKIKISSVVTLEFDFKEKQEEKDGKKILIEDIKKDVWS